MKGVTSGNVCIVLQHSGKPHCTTRDCQITTNHGLLMVLTMSHRSGSEKADCFDNVGYWLAGGGPHHGISADSIENSGMGLGKLKWREHKFPTQWAV